VPTKAGPSIQAVPLIGGRIPPPKQIGDIGSGIPPGIFWAT
jgi:hypothetical protein